MSETMNILSGKYQSFVEGRAILFFMKFFFLLIDSFIIILVLSSCSGISKNKNISTTTNTDLSTIDMSAAPQWVNKGIPSSFCGIGVAKVKNRSDVALKIARKYAIYSIASHLNAKISSYLDDYNNIEEGNRNVILRQLVARNVDFSLTKGIWWTSKMDYVFLIRCIEQEEFEQIVTSLPGNK